MFRHARTLASVLAAAALAACQDAPTLPHAPTPPPAGPLPASSVALESAALTAGSVYAEVTGPVGIRLTFEARGTPAAASGFVRYRNTLGQEFTGSVTCYDQRENVAVFSGVITDANYAGHDGTFYVAVQDNGEGDGAAPDRFRVLDYTYYFQGGCTNWEQAVFPAEVSQGNIQVLR